MNRKLVLRVFGAGLLAFGLANHLSLAADEEPAKAKFSRTTIDLGMVVSDIEKSADFYANVIGFTEAPGFNVPGEFCKDAGLTDGKSLAIRVFVLGEGPDATKLKIMSVPGANAKKSDNSFIHSQLGYSYLTIFVSDMSAALQRMKKAGVKPLAKSPIAIGGGNGPSLTLLRDPDGNLIELIGPQD